MKKEINQNTKRKTYSKIQSPRVKKFKEKRSKMKNIQMIQAN